MHSSPSLQGPSADSAKIRSKERLILLAVLCLAVAHGLIYVFVVPPWSHYDEPTHFEYAWWIANRLRLPQAGDADPGMRREVAASMLEHGFYRERGGRPELLPRSEPIHLGISEFSHPPLYYVLVALPLRLLRHTDVTFQLYLGRLVSLLLYLTSIAIAFGLVRELVPPGHLLRWTVPAAMALLPSYTDLMTAVNNDVGAVVTMSLFLWGAVRTIVRGPSPLHLVWILLAALIGLFTKNTAAIAVPLLPLVLVLAWVRRAPPWPAWTAVLVAGFGLVVFLFSWGDAAQWFRLTPQRSPTSRRVVDAPEGTRALALEFDLDTVTSKGVTLGNQVMQILPNKDVVALRGITVTLGAWIWATQPVRVHTPVLNDGTQYVATAVKVDQRPVFHTLTATVSAEAGYIQVALNPAPQLAAKDLSIDGASQSPLIVYYDGIVLAEQEHPLANRVRNGSAERAAPYIRPMANEILKRYIRLSPSQFLTSLLDWQRTSWIYPQAALNLFQSFWARFGWNHIGVPKGWYWALGILAFLGGVGSAISYPRWRKCKAYIQRSIGLLCVAGLSIWFTAFLRVHPVAPKPIIPVARYAYPAIIPSLLALVAGWHTLVPARYRRWLGWAILALFLTIDVVSIWTLWEFYYRR